MTSSPKISGRYVLLDKDDVVRLLRWDLTDVGWQSFRKSLFKSRGMALTQGCLGSLGGCICTLCFLDWARSIAFFSSHRMISRMAMRWMDDIYIRICFMMKNCRRYDYHILSQRAEDWFEQVLNIYNGSFNFKREDHTIFVGMDIGCLTGHIKMKQHINHDHWKLQHNCAAGIL